MHTQQLTENSTSSQLNFEHEDMVATEGKADRMAHVTIRAETIK